MILTKEKFKLKQRSKSNGFSLAEALLSLLILVISMSSAFYIYTASSAQRTHVETLVEVLVVRNNVLNYLKSTLSWQNTVTANGSGSMACLVNHTDCAGILAAPGAATNGKFVLRDLGNNVVFDPTVATNGFQTNGQACTAFVAAPGVPDLNCVLGLNLYWEPICPTIGDCIDPLVRIHAEFSYNAPVMPGRRDPPIPKLNFQLDQIARYCPGTVPGFGLLDLGGTTTSVSAPPPPLIGTVVSNSVAQVYPAGRARNSANIPACQSAMVEWQVAVAGPITEAENQSDVCLVDASVASPGLADCLFRWHHFYSAAISADSWELYDASGTLVFPSAGFNPQHGNGNLYSFKIDRGRVQFYQNGLHFFTFAKGIKSVAPAGVANIRVLYMPPSQRYSAIGLQSLSLRAL